MTQVDSKMEIRNVFYYQQYNLANNLRIVNHIFNNKKISKPKSMRMAGFFTVPILRPLVLEVIFRK